MAGLPGGTLVARGDRFWGHPSPTVEPDQNKGRSPGSRGGSAVLGQPREQWPSVFPAQPACQQFTRSGGPEGELGPRKRGGQVQDTGKGPSLPRKGGEDKGHGDGTQGDTRLLLRWHQGTHTWRGMVTLPVCSSVQQTGPARMQQPLLLCRENRGPGQ